VVLVTVIQRKVGSCSSFPECSFHSNPGSLLLLADIEVGSSTLSDSSDEPQRYTSHILLLCGASWAGDSRAGSDNWVFFPTLL
jgi:hypothetical protein